MLFNQIKTASNLKSFVENGSDSFFFERKTMAFFGDTMRNFGIVKWSHNGKQVIELYRKRAVKHGLNRSHYFEQFGSYSAKTISLQDDQIAALTKWVK